MRSHVWQLVWLLSLLYSACAAHEDEVAYLPLSRRSAEDRAHFLFRRQATNYPPADVKGPAPRQAWIDAYNAAKAAGQIPAIPPSTVAGTYPAGTNMNAVCSWTVNKCMGNDSYNAPDGVIGIAFDDGPQLPSPPLYAFLEQNNQSATHFMIGSRILDNQALFRQALNDHHQIGDHSWSHPQMTTLSDMGVLGEIGWTMQIIYDLSGGLLPSLWRPPYGDTDARVRAIANIFGLHGVIWNHDSFDWCLNNAGVSSCPASLGGPANPAALQAELTGWINGPKSPGLLFLEHELSTSTVNGFIQAYPLMKQAEWRTLPLNEALNVPLYQNKATVNSPMINGTIAQPVAAAVSSLPSSASSSLSSSSVSSATNSSSRSSSVRSSASSAASGIVASAVASSTSASSSLSTAAIAGTAAGGAVVLLLAILAAVLCCRRRAAKRESVPIVFEDDDMHYAYKGSFYGSDSVLGSKTSLHEYRQSALGEYRPGSSPPPGLASTRGSLPPGASPQHSPVRPYSYGPIYEQHTRTSRYAR